MCMNNKDLFVHPTEGPTVRGRVFPRSDDGDGDDEGDGGGEEGGGGGDLASCLLSPIESFRDPGGKILSFWQPTPSHSSLALTANLAAIQRANEEGAHIHLYIRTRLLRPKNPSYENMRSVLHILFEKRNKSNKRDEMYRS